MSPLAPASGKRVRVRGLCHDCHELRDFEALSLCLPWAPTGGCPYTMLRGKRPQQYVTKLMKDRSKASKRAANNRRRLPWSA
jgi:hypothetical protein